MTIDDVKNRVSKIETLAEKDDNMAAHIKEDFLLQDVLEFIASGKCTNPEYYATEVLKVTELQYDRWYA